MSHSEEIRLCPRCRAELGREARFCRLCGAPTQQNIVRRQQELAIEQKEISRAVWAIAVVFAGTLVGLIIAAILPLGPGYSYERLAASIVIDLACGVAAAAFLPGRIAVQAWFTTANGRDFALAIAYAAGAFAFSLAWVGLVRRILDTDEAATITPEARLAFVLFVVVKAPLIEEWLCRGIMWEAMRRIAGPSATVAGTAMLFAFLHILGGGGYAELPHRFVAGILFGILRLKSGSIWPGVFAHFLNNLAATIVMFA